MPCPPPWTNPLPKVTQGPGWGCPCPALPCAITGHGGRDSTGTTPRCHPCPLCAPCPGTVRPRGSGLGFHLPAPLSSPLPVSCLHFLLPPSTAHADEPHAGAHPRAHRLLMRLEWVHWAEGLWLIPVPILVPTRASISSGLRAPVGPPGILNLVPEIRVPMASLP